jgi:putative membrane protein
MMIIWIVILIAIGFGVYYFMNNKSMIPGVKETPLEILNKRYAGGELTKEEYEQMKNELK